MARAIDAIPERDAHSREMQVLALGLSRTGTLSTKAALNKLGYRTYHFNEIAQLDLPNERHMPSFFEAQMAKIRGNGKPYGSAEFQKLLRNYSAVTDTPCACFPDELIKAFPEAKVVLATRDPDRWLASMETVYYQLLESRDVIPVLWRMMAVAVPRVKILEQSLQLCLEQWTGGDWTNRDKLRQGFLNHIDHVRSITPPEMLLEWRVQDGWEPLCQFLGKPIPDEPFPFENEGKKVLTYVYTRSLLTALITVVGASMAQIAAVTVGLLSLTWYCLSTLR